MKVYALLENGRLRDVFSSREAAHRECLDLIEKWNKERNGLWELTGNWDILKNGFYCGCFSTCEMEVK